LIADSQHLTTAEMVNDYAADPRSSLEERRELIVEHFPQRDPRHARTIIWPTAGSPGRTTAGTTSTSRTSFGTLALVLTTGVGDGAFSKA
jgi:hypothetical protein